MTIKGMKWFDEENYSNCIIIGEKPNRALVTKLCGIPGWAFTTESEPGRSKFFDMIEDVAEAGELNIPENGLYDQLIRKIKIFYKVEEA